MPSFSRHALTFPELPATFEHAEDAEFLPLLRQIATAYAVDLWGAQIALGAELPLCDASGGLTAYAFLFRRDGTSFAAEVFAALANEPALIEVAESVAADEVGGRAATVRHESSKVLGKCGCVYVSARCNRPPVIGAIYTAHPYWEVGLAAKLRAIHALGTDELHLECIHFLDPAHEYFAFRSDHGRVLVDAHTLEIKAEEEAFGAEQEEGTVSFAPREPGGPAPRGVDPIALDAATVEKRIPNWELIPVVNWTYWCVPTAKAMVLGFWDNYVREKGTIIGFGRLIDFWYQHTDPRYPNNVPNLIDEVLPGKDVWTLNKYACQWTETKAEKANDWAWATLKAEIDAGRPAFWSFAGHTMAAFGYRIRPTGKYVIAYNTWGHTAEQQLSEWEYSRCVGVGAVIPTGALGGEHLVLGSPDGSETFAAGDPTEISWYVWGTKISKANLYYSGDAGNHWTPIALGRDTKAGWNHFIWVPEVPASKARARVDGVTASGDLIAADGTHTDFAVMATALKHALSKVKSLRIEDGGGEGAAAADLSASRYVVYLQGTPQLELEMALRPGLLAAARKQVWKTLRLAFEKSKPARIDYLETGSGRGVILRAWLD